MTKTSAQRVAAPDIVDTVERYHAAVNALDFDAIESFLTETVVYVSDGVGVFEGRDAVMQGFRTYFAEYGDQVAEDELVEAISERAVRSVWKLTATSSKTGQKLVRSGEETAFLDREGFIEKVIVRDRTPANGA
jgi:ketosteroid isomerase-like protein